LKVSKTEKRENLFQGLPPSFHEVKEKERIRLVGQHTQQWYRQRKRVEKGKRKIARKVPRKKRTR
jgi:hypothetical protein